MSLYRMLIGKCPVNPCGGEGWKQEWAEGDGEPDAGQAVATAEPAPSGALELGGWSEPACFAPKWPDLYTPTLGHRGKGMSHAFCI